MVFISFSRNTSEWAPSNEAISSIVEHQCNNYNTDEKSKHQYTSRPCFSTFSKKSFIEELNRKISLEQDVIVKPKKENAKTVHFDEENLEQVCYFSNDQPPSQAFLSKQSTHSIIFHNWPNSHSKLSNILVNKEAVSISSDNTCIIGKLMIRNLAPNKSVLIKYTFNDWLTSKVVSASLYSSELKRMDYDIYQFMIQLDQLADSTMLIFTVKLTLHNQEYWDNHNYHINIISSNAGSSDTLYNDTYDFTQLITSLKNITYETCAGPLHQPYPLCIVKDFVSTKHDAVKSDTRACLQMFKKYC